MSKKKSEIVELTFSEFKKKTGVGPAELARICGTEKQYVNGYKNRLKGDHVIRYSEETGDVQVVKVEKIMCHGNLNRKR